MFQIKASELPPAFCINALNFLLLKQKNLDFSRSHFTGFGSIYKFTGMGKSKYVANGVTAENSA